MFDDEPRPKWTYNQKRNSAIAGLIAFCILFAAGLWWQDNAISTYQPRPRLSASPVWQVGNWIVITRQVDAAESAGPAYEHGLVCVFFPDTTGYIVEIGGPLSNPRGYVEVSSQNCSGWVPITAIRMK